ncbi:MAG: acyl-CoA dehydrogenase family protein [Acidimicrobiales bacterium]
MTNPGRDDLLAWRASKPTNYYTAVPGLESELSLHMGSRLTDALATKLNAFGDVVATEIEPAVQAIERNREFPTLRSYDELGQHVERIEFHPAHDDAARAAWASGMLATSLDYEGAFELAARFFLLSHVGEGGQACPIVCTIGLRRALEHRGSESLKAQHLAGLMETDSLVALRGSQFLTEVQGGSDVGANSTSATPDPEIEGAWRISGEKWFCSVADADLFAMTARPESAQPGTKGLALFLVPRTIDGVTPNGFRIRRLKDKLGTRGLASGEIDFDNALAYPIGELDEGFAIAVSELLNTSRWLNAIGSTGIMSRAYLEASSFAHHRQAFGSTIVSFDAVREQLAMMKIEVAASLASTMALTDLVAKIDEGTATDEDLKVHRFLVNANKYVTSISATDVVHRAIEVLGGNGTIEDFSPLPRLYRDSIVFESWEGTHNVLCDQVRRDCMRLGLLDVVADWIHVELGQVPTSQATDPGLVRQALDDLKPGLEKSIGNSESGNFRRQLTQLVRIIQATCLLRSNSAMSSPFIRIHLVAQVPAGDPPWLAFLDAVLD